MSIPHPSQPLHPGDAAPTDRRRRHRGRLRAAQVGLAGGAIVGAVAVAALVDTGTASASPDTDATTSGTSGTGTDSGTSTWGQGRVDPGQSQDPSQGQSPSAPDARSAGS